MDLGDDDSTASNDDDDILHDSDVLTLDGDDGSTHDENGSVGCDDHDDDYGFDEDDSSRLMIRITQRTRSPSTEDQLFDVTRYLRQPKPHESIRDDELTQMPDLDVVVVRAGLQASVVSLHVISLTFSSPIDRSYLVTSCQCSFGGLTKQRLAEISCLDWDKRMVTKS
ncbi:unnamed protein product [Calicophoron daubneyi]|uniref:Uncharacterized protein n=1 Tax=Calicophoron daubneyi TaxID=300641 RepID=A0AAV2THB1_CALDB